MRVTTQDLYCGAYILSKGGRLEETNLARGRSGRPFVSFTFSGPNVEDISNEYQSGRAIADMAAFKIAMEHLKDIIYEKTRACGQ
ncbi:MAG: hypothetical protein ACM3X9_01000 [Bacillota bacterium]